MDNSYQQSNPIKLWRSFLKEQNTKENKPDDVGYFSVGLVGSFTLDPMLPYLGGSMIKSGIHNPDIILGPYNQIFQTCFNYGDSFRNVKNKLDAIVILWRLEDLFKQHIVKAIVDGNLAPLYNALDDLSNAIKTLRDSFDGGIMVTVPPYPHSLPEFNLHDLKAATSGNLVYSNAVSYFLDNISNIEQVNLIDMHACMQGIGYTSNYDSRRWYLYKQPYNDKALTTISNYISRTLAAQVKASKKCIVLDCDNTLWGGIVGEDNISGIQLGNDFPGSAFRDFQHSVKSINRRGIFLAVASKNNEQDVLEVFESHDCMVLKKEDISVFQVHWKSKVDSLLAIAKTLNIGTDSLVFIDDNPKEIGEVNTRLPDVTCLLVPEELSELPELLKYEALFDSQQITEEDSQRVNMQASENVRLKAKLNTTEEDFLKSLELAISVFEVEPEHLARVTQLINKTNQFNLTTIRRTPDEVRSLSHSKNSLVLAMKAADKYGDYGIVGVAIAKRINSSDWELDTFLMSCRILGRKVETAFLSSVAKAVEMNKGDLIRGYYFETAKNKPIKNFLKSHGFTTGQKENEWVASTSNILFSPSFINTELKLIDV